MIKIIKPVAIILSCILLGIIVGHPLAWGIMYLDEYEINRDITRGERNVGYGH